MRVFLDHIGIAVQDIDQALAFYRDALIAFDFPYPALEECLKTPVVRVSNEHLERYHPGRGLPHLRILVDEEHL